ncbi:MAG: hypothetical protein UW41_C0001G0047 [Candidatus Collierbacteria bacterium GW2011_GWC2_44_18]|uniref:Uncharacterized protein n=2 Tax=Microgenomates group TaxID=1794810 RepID=A0A0G1J8S6_9BACT|nr:MAG: hypothetical protein UW16_C0009G0003 [Microgenomates group bacterium GW2011_GWC1_44_10]KKT49901.1 MAG: hypothetical protein UW41_C0001G0047 [Candidatus Collierbacteria bacterium GW2011_GWC2_44_18]KKT67650.1 MAG: hypothetical protein UW60_C0002G0002 [Candidatus Woesebacteria bacterium GW2011_GWA2_44_33]
MVQPTFILYVLGWCVDLSEGGWSRFPGGHQISNNDGENGENDYFGCVGHRWFTFGHLISVDIISGSGGWGWGGDSPDSDNELVDGRSVCFESTLDQFHIGIKLEQESSWIFGVTIESGDIRLGFVECGLNR